MTIACPACSHENRVLPESPSLDWQVAACAACEANLVLVKSHAAQSRPSSPIAATKSGARRSSSKNTSWWSRFRPRMLGSLLVVAGTERHITSGMLS